MLLRSLVKLCPAAALALVSAFPLAAWSDTGHRIVAKIAEQHLNQNAQRRLRLVMGSGATLEGLSTWAGAIVNERPETEAWHSITIPRGAKRVDLHRDCPLGDCVTVKIRECEGIVRLSIRDKADIVEAFQFLVHLAGDLHQPMNAGYPPDPGHPEPRVLLDGETLELFELWDSVLLRRLYGGDPDIAAIAQRLNAAITATEKKEWSSGLLTGWTWETHQIAVNIAYGALPEGDPAVVDERYLELAQQTVEQQLAKAGIRLAELVNRTWP